MTSEHIFVAFGDQHLIAHGGLGEVLPRIKAWTDEYADHTALIFEEHTGRQVDFDLRGTVEEVVSRAIPPIDSPTVGPGRPKLGVVAREVTLLPRHWEWLEQEPSGASAALRRLVDQARKQQESELGSRMAADAICRFLSAMAGNLPGYEEATRALYAGDQAVFVERISAWPKDIRDYTAQLAKRAFVSSPGA